MTQPLVRSALLSVLVVVAVFNSIGYFAHAQGILDGLLGSLLGGLGQLLESLLELLGPITAPVKELLEGILNALQAGLPLTVCQVEGLLNALNLSSILDLPDPILEKLAEYANISAIVEIEKLIPNATDC